MNHIWPTTPTTDILCLKSPRATECHLPGVACLDPSHGLQFLPHLDPWSVLDGQAGVLPAYLCCLQGTRACASLWFCSGHGDLLISPVWLQSTFLYHSCPSQAMLSLFCHVDYLPGSYTLTCTGLWHTGSSLALWLFTCLAISQPLRLWVLLGCSKFGLALSRHSCPSLLPSLLHMLLSLCSWRLLMPSHPWLFSQGAALESLLAAGDPWLCPGKDTWAGDWDSSPDFLLPDCVILSHVTSLNFCFFIGKIKRMIVMKILLTWLALKVLTGTMMLHILWGFYLLSISLWWSDHSNLSPITKKKSENKNTTVCWTSLVVLWLRICLPMQVAWIRSLVQEDSIYWGATKPMCHNYWSLHTLEPVLCNKRSHYNGKPAHRSWRGAPTRRK